MTGRIGVGGKGESSSRFHSNSPRPRPSFNFPLMFFVLEPWLYTACSVLWSSNRLEVQTKSSRSPLKRLDNLPPPLTLPPSSPSSSFLTCRLLNPDHFNLFVPSSLPSLPPSPIADLCFFFPSSLSKIFSTSSPSSSKTLLSQSLPSSPSPRLFDLPSLLPTSFSDLKW